MEDVEKKAAGGLANVLVLEDNAILAIDVEDMLRDMGAGTVRVALTVSDARQHIETGITFALLDFTLKDETAASFAYDLEERSIPFLFVTGYSDSGTLPEALRSRPMLGKPFTQDALSDAIQDVLDNERAV